MSMKIICGCDDDDYEDYKWLFDDKHFDPDDWDYIVDGGLFMEADDFTKISYLVMKLESYDSVVKEIGGRIYAVTYH